MTVRDETRTAPVLVVDDRRENLEVMKAILAPLDQEIVLAASGEEALRAMLRQDFAVVLLDVRMPGMDGYDTASVIKSRERTRHVPIIFLTALDDNGEAARRGYDVGAVDYLFKPIDPVILRSKVNVFLDLFHLKREAESLAHRALHDPLTQLPNRMLFRDRLEPALARTERSRHSLGVFFIDLDGFKGVNDRLGHDAGDALLVRVAARMRDVMRAGDTVARLGGDEFAILSETIGDARHAEDIAARIVAAVEAEAPAGAFVSASVGIALANGRADADGLLREADTAMYAAKAAGGRSSRLAGSEPLAC